MTKTETNHHPIYCRECHSQNSFERNPDKDIKAESGQAFMLSWKCRVCGHTTSMTNPNFEILSKQKEVIEASRKDWPVAR